MSENSITLGEKEYQLVKTGRAQAHQVVEFTKWLSVHAFPVFESFATPDGKQQEDLSYMDIFSVALEKLTAPALVELFRVLVGCSKKEAEEYFDIGLLAEAGIVIWDNQPGVRRLVERFFSTLA